MSEKWLLYGVISSSGGDYVGLDGNTVPVWWVDIGLSNDRWVGFSIKGNDLSVGDVVAVVECGDTNDTWGALWGLIPYADAMPSVVGVRSASQAREFAWAYPATSALNYLCRYSGAIGRLYWPARITSIGSTTAMVTDRWATYTRELPFSSDLTPADFSAGDYVLVYDLGARAEIVGWWMMKPGIYTEYNRYRAEFSWVWLSSYPGGTINVTLRLANTFTFASPNVNSLFTAGTYSSVNMSFFIDAPVPAGAVWGSSSIIPIPVGGWKSSMWPLVEESSYFNSTSLLDPTKFYTE